MPKTLFIAVIANLHVAIMLVKAGSLSSHLVAMLPSAGLLILYLAWHFTSKRRKRRLFMMNPDSSVPDALRWACVPRWFTEDIFFSTLGQNGATCRSAATFKDVTSSDLCRPHGAVQGAYEIIPEMRHVVNRQSREDHREFWLCRQGALKDFHAARSDSSGPDVFIHRVEMVYHSLFVDEGTGTDLLDELFQEHLDVHNLARCQAFVEAGRDWAGEWLHQAVGTWRLRLCEAELLLGSASLAGGIRSFSFSRKSGPRIVGETSY
ncbi:MAG: hypothetical protein MZV70_13220 [Desulfobacterales bacterium]|nr:hypothetical protein [Desulfobacterales bacterium]